MGFQDWFVRNFGGEALAETLERNPNLESQLETMRANLPDDIEHLVMPEGAEVDVWSLLAPGDIDVPAIAANPTAMAQLVAITGNPDFHALLRNDNVSSAVQSFTSSISAADSDPAQQAAAIAAITGHLEQNPRLFDQINRIVGGLPENMRSEMVQQLMGGTGGPVSFPAILSDPTKMETLSRMANDPGFARLMENDQLRAAIVSSISDPSSDGSATLDSWLQTYNSNNAVFSQVADMIAASPERAQEIIAQNIGADGTGRPPSIAGDGALMGKVLDIMRADGYAQLMEGPTDNPALLRLRGMMTDSTSGTGDMNAYVNGLHARLQQNDQLLVQLNTLITTNPTLAGSIIEQFSNAEGTVQIPELLGQPETMAKVVAIAENPDFQAMMENEALAPIRDIFIGQLTAGTIGNSGMIDNLHARMEADAAAGRPSVFAQLESFAAANPDMVAGLATTMRDTPEAAGHLLTVGSAAGFNEMMDMIQNDERFSALKEQLMQGDSIDPDMLASLARQVEQNDQFFVQMRDMMNRRPGLMNSAATMMSLMGQNGSLNGLDPAQGMSMMLSMDQLLTAVGSFLGPEAASALEGLLGQFMEGFAPMLAQVRSIGTELGGSLNEVLADAGLNGQRAGAEPVEAGQPAAEVPVDPANRTAPVPGQS